MVNREQAAPAKAIGNQVDDFTKAPSHPLKPELVAVRKSFVVPIPPSRMTSSEMRQAFASTMGVMRENLWFGEVLLTGFKFHPLVLLFAISGSLMISRIRIPKI